MKSFSRQRIPGTASCWNLWPVVRVGEVLKLTPRDVNDRKLILRDPKSGKEKEIVFIPQKVADRLKDYIREKGIEPDQGIFPICYEAARATVKKAG